MGLNQISQVGSYAYSDVRSVALRKAFLLLGVSVIAAIATGLFALNVGLISNGFSLAAMIVVLVASFIVPRMGDSPLSYALVIAIGGLLGLAAIPMVAFYIGTSGIGVVLNALVSTAAIFITLSAYAVISRKDFTNIGGILFVGMISVLVVGIANAFFIHSSFVQVILSYVVALLSCGLILFRLSVAVNHGLYSVTSLALGLLVDVYNLFISLLSIFGNRE